MDNTTNFCVALLKTYTDQFLDAAEHNFNKGIEVSVSGVFDPTILGINFIIWLNLRCAPVTPILLDVNGIESLCDFLPAFEAYYTALSKSPDLVNNYNLHDYNRSIELIREQLERLDEVDSAELQERIYNCSLDKDYTDLIEEYKSHE